MIELLEKLKSVSSLPPEESNIKPIYANLSKDLVIGLNKSVWKHGAPSYSNRILPKGTSVKIQTVRRDDKIGISVDLLSQSNLTSYVDEADLYNISEELSIITNPPIKSSTKDIWIRGFELLRLNTSFSLKDDNGFSALGCLVEMIIRNEYIKDIKWSNVNNIYSIRGEESFLSEDIVDWGGFWYNYGFAIMNHGNIIMPNQFRFSKEQYLYLITGLPEEKDAK